MTSIPLEPDPGPSLRVPLLASTVALTLVPDAPASPPGLSVTQPTAWPPLPASLSVVEATTAEPISTDTLLARCGKRTLDVTVSVAVLILTAPLLLALVLLIRRDHGPALFRQTRIGRGGRPIDVFKFRSMAADAEALLAADPELQARHRANGHKLPPDEDPRITRLGHVLRASSLDELPQLLNVLRGEMSLVGPRPVVPVELSEYWIRGAGPAYLSVRPGMTGAWQVSGRSLLGYDQRIALDVHYVEHRGLLADVSILLRTAGVVMRRIGAH